MEVMSQTPIASPYVTASTSPCAQGPIQLWIGESYSLTDCTNSRSVSVFAFGSESTLYDSAPTSPTKRIGNTFSDHEYASFKTITTSSNSDDFEFETSVNFDWPVDDNGLEQERHQQQHERGGSVSTMAFADELFCNGQVMPLKLPPRLQSSQGSIASSPRSPSSAFKVPFSRRIAWNNDFDPFMVALQKVTEEKRGRRRSEKSHDHNTHRRTRSHSPFRTTTLEWSNEDGHLKPMQNCGPNSFKPMEPKGFIYARWVRDQTKHVGTSPKVTKKYSFMGIGGKVKDSSVHEIFVTEGVSETNGDSVTMETKMQRIKGLLLKYASFGRKNNNNKLNRNFLFWKPIYFPRLSFKFKKSGNGNGKEEKMEVVKYKPALCIGYGIVSPSK